MRVEYSKGERASKELILLHRQTSEATSGRKFRIQNEAPCSKLRGILRNSPKPRPLLRQGYGGFSSPSSPQQATGYSAKENKR